MGIQDQSLAVIARAMGQLAQGQEPDDCIVSNGGPAAVLPLSAAADFPPAGGEGEGMLAPAGAASPDLPRQYPSFVGKRYRCHDPDSMFLGEVVEIDSHGMGAADPLVGHVDGGECHGAPVIVKRADFLTHYLAVTA